MRPCALCGPLKQAAYALRQPSPAAQPQFAHNAAPSPSSASAAFLDGTGLRLPLALASPASVTAAAVAAFFCLLSVALALRSAIASWLRMRCVGGGRAVRGQQQMRNMRMRHPGGSNVSPNRVCRQGETTAHPQLRADFVGVAALVVQQALNQRRVKLGELGRDRHDLGACCAAGVMGVCRCGYLNITITCAGPYPHSQAAQARQNSP